MDKQLWNEDLKEVNDMIMEANEIKEDLKSNIEKAYKYYDFELFERCVASKAKMDKTLRELRKLKKEIMLTIAENTESKTLTEDAVSPVAELSRLLTDDFEKTEIFGSVNSETISNLIERKLSHEKIHETVLNNFPGIKFRKQNGGYTYTLRYRNMGVLLD